MVGVTMPSYPTRVLPERHFSPTTFLLGAQLPGLPTFQVGEPGQETYQVSNEYIYRIYFVGNTGKEVRSIL